MVDVHGPSSCFEECQRFLNLYSLIGITYILLAIHAVKYIIPFVRRGEGR